ncbi:MAG: AAA family ATPase, partial [Planctomycetes bacterium]|nr:AAA family ATPase [Planctomycetota bacterium]
VSVLGGIDETAFTQRFGIDYEELRRGGNLLVSGGGDLGEILFAAGTGAVGLSAVQQQLQEDAEALFKPRGSNQRIAVNLSELERLRKEIRDTQLPTSQWVEHDRELRKAEKRQRELDAELNRKRIERSRLDRIRQSLPLIGRLGPLRAALANVADAPLLLASFSVDRREAELKLATAQTDEAQAHQECERLQRELKSVQVPTELVEHRTAITQLHAELGSYQKAAQDRPRLVAQRDSAQRDAANRVTQLARPASLTEADSLRLSKLQRRKIQDLAGEFKALFEAQRLSQEEFQKLGERIQRVQAEVDRLPPERNVADLDRTIRQVQKSGNLDAQTIKAQAELDRLIQQSEIALARLPLFQGTLAELEKLPLPNLETIERFETVLADAEVAVRRCREKLERLNEDRLRVQSQLDILRLERDVPTEVELSAIRQRRDVGWDLIQKVGLDAAANQPSPISSPALDRSVAESAQDFVAEFAPGGNLLVAFRASIEQADLIADRLRREADRVAQRAQLTAELQQIEADLGHSTQACTEAEHRREQLGCDWQSQWTPTGIEPLSPREMRSWRTPQQELVEVAAEIRQRQADLQLVHSQISSYRAELNTCLAALDLPTRVAEESLAQTLDFCEETVALIKKQNQQRERQASELESLRESLPEAERKAQGAQDALHEWRSNWAQAVATIGLDADAQPAEANAVLETVDELLQAVDESRRLDERISGIDADAQQFQLSVRQLLAQVASDLVDTANTSTERAVADLVDRLNRALTDQTKIQSWQEQLQKQQVAREAAATRMTQAQQQLRQLCVQAGCDSPGELPQAEERAAQRRQAETEIQALEQRLGELAGGATLAGWIEQTEQADADRVAIDLQALDEGIAALEQEKQSVSEALGAHRNELKRMDGSSKAADAQNEAEHLLAAIRGDAEQYVRCRLAAAILSRAMERFRQTSQGPVLARASELFAMLTLGSFAGLQAEYDEKGHAVLVGVRANRQKVPVSGMSEGTCDQIYLALRIALLESSLVGREPLPLIVDDILAMYDDQRAGAALRVLWQLSTKTQVILFTHHSHLVEIARQLPDLGALSVIEL